MKMKTEYIQNLSAEMVENDKDLIKHLNGIDDMINLAYELPEEIRKLKWVRKIVSTDPQAALKTSVRTLSTVEPVPFYQPTNPNDTTLSSASQIEMNLLWQLKQMNKRSQFNITSDIVESALRYDIVAVQVIPLKWQLEALEKMGGKAPTRYRAAKNLGTFMGVVHNPKGIHARYTPLGLDKVLSVKVMKANEAIAFYGEERTRELVADMEEEEGELYVTVFDYWDYNQRVIWAANSGRAFHKMNPNTRDYTFMNEEMDLPFLPWSIKKGGTSLEFKQENSVRPMLGTIEKSRMWESQNIMKSLTFSEAIGYAAAPRYKIKEMGQGGSVRIDYGDINKPVRLSQNEDIEQLPPPSLDENLLHLNDRLQAMLDKDTVAKALQNLDFPSGTAFATVNAVIKSATAALDPYKQLAERALSGMFEDMLRWTEYTGEPLEGFGYHEKDKGTQYALSPDDIDPESIYIDVKLSAHVPTDYLQRIEAAIALNQQLDFPKDEAYKQLDVPNSDQIMDKWEQERLNQHALQLKMREMAAESDLKTQQKQMALQMQMQQAAQQQQPQPTQSEQRFAGQGRSRPPNPAEMRRAMQGNPAKTGNSPNQSNPTGNLRERVNRQAKGGEETAI